MRVRLSYLLNVYFHKHFPAEFSEGRYAIVPATFHAVETASFRYLISLIIDIAMSFDVFVHAEMLAVAINIKGCN